jgi:chromatin segregation and condensation protein Rec8/ScpA/Scc1 (kleisin family)
LLLYLIRKQNFNILDIPMAQLTLQYLKYVDQIRLSNRTGGGIPVDGGHADRD